MAWVLLLVLLLFGIDSAGAQKVIDRHGVSAVPDGRGGTKLVKNRKRAVSRVAPSAAGFGIRYHGGPIMPGPLNVYYVWYGDWSAGNAIVLLSDFAGAIGGSDWLNMLSTYSTNLVTFKNAASFAGSVSDSYSEGLNVTDAGVYRVLKRAFDLGLPKDDNGVYFVLTARDVNLTSGLCRSYCGWHTYNYFGGVKIKYAAVGNPSRCMNACSGQRLGPNGEGESDALVSMVGHELQEMQSDPYLNGWFDDAGKENADKCAWTFGTKYRAENGAFFNIQIGKRKYLMQQNWINVPGKPGNSAMTGFCGLSW